MKKVRLVFVGIGGYGATNLEHYLLHELTGCELAGVVDVCPEKSYFYQQILDEKIPIYHSLEEFYENDSADLAVLSTPIPLHAPQSIYCMRHGSNVLCEKPLASTVEQGLEMLRVSKETGRFVNIGYQASFAPANLAFKKDYAAGKFGKILSAKTLVLWPRTEKYYGRSPWAGKLKDAHGGWILDSIANNATAHYLHNLFYILGKDDNVSLKPDRISFELYRGNDIETFDTCALRAEAGGVPLLYLVSHTVDRMRGPVIEFAFEKATVTAEAAPGNGPSSLTATFKDGTAVDYGNFQDGRCAKIQYSIDMILSGKPAVAGIEASIPQLTVIQAFHKDPAYIHVIPTETMLKEDNDILHYVPGMFEDLERCYGENLLPSEAGLPWASSPVTCSMD